MSSAVVGEQLDVGVVVSADVVLTVDDGELERLRHGGVGGGAGVTHRGRHLQIVDSGHELVPVIVVGLQSAHLYLDATVVLGRSREIAGHDDVDELRVGGHHEPHGEVRSGAVRVDDAGPQHHARRSRVARGHRLWEVRGPVRSRWNGHSNSESEEAGDECETPEDHDPLLLAQPPTGLAGSRSEPTMRVFEQHESRHPSYTGYLGRRQAPPLRLASRVSVLIVLLLASCFSRLASHATSSSSPALTRRA